MTPRRILSLCYAASGAAALVYQVAWVRMFTLTLGHTVAASSTVLAAFMFGLAIGAWAAGRFPVARDRSLFVYAGLELLVAVVAIALPVIFAGAEPLLVQAYADGTAPVRFAMVRVAISFLLLGVPAAAMGATYPVAVSWLARTETTRRDERVPVAGDAGSLYAINTAGAAAGAIAAGFWLIPSLGIRATTWVAVVLNVLAALGAIWLGRAQTAATTAMPRVTKKRRLSPPISSPRPLVAAFAAGISGLAALVFEVTWTRLLALVFGPTTYAFALMTASFVSGIAIGSSLGVRMVRRGANASRWLAAMLAATGITTVAAAWFTASHLLLIFARQAAAATAFEPLLVREALAVALLLLPASLASGAAFTLALATSGAGIDTAARDTARVYAANTVGAVFGALLAGFVLIPRFGLQATFTQTGCLLAVSAIVVAFAAARGEAGQRTRLFAAAAFIGAIVVAAIVALPDWDRDLITSGAYKYARLIPAGDLEASLRAGRLEYYKEGAAGTVSVRRLAGTRSLAIDGKVDASSGGDMLTQRLLGLLPTLLHPNPHDALVIGLGSGVTADAMLASGRVQRLDIVEISPEVVEASRYFDRQNRGVLKKPGVRLLVGDGRSHLRLSATQYDVIVSEPSNPWMAGVASLFTHEFFEAARARLRSGGVFCQWAHTYEISEADLRSIVHTFAAVFPDGTMWLAGESDLLLIGSAAGDIQSRLKGVAERSRSGSLPPLLSDVAVDQKTESFVLLSFFAGGPAALAAFGGAADLQTDDRMALEFTAARAMYEPPEGNAVVRAITPGAGVPPIVADQLARAAAADWTARGRVALRAKAFGMAQDSFRRAVALDSRSLEALRGSTDAASGARRLDEEAEFLKRLAAAEPDNGAVRVELSHTMATLGNLDAAIEYAMQAGRLDPDRPEPLEQLASVVADAGDAGRLAPIADELLKRFPSREDGRYYQAVALFLAGRAADAERAIRMLIGANPRHAKAQNLLGALCASRANRDCAQAAFAAASELDPDDPSVYVNLGYLSVERGDTKAAASFFSEALVLDPRSDAARRGLTDATAAQP